MDKISISVFFPCHNEGENIKKLLTDTAKFLPTIASDYEIIVVDDGSIDSTAEIAKTFSQNNPFVKVVQHQKNMGYGAALRTGFVTSQKDYIFFTDADNQFNITELSKLVPYLKHYDIVAGFRINRKDNFFRRVNAKSFNLFIRLLFGLKIKDLNCAFKVFKKEVLKNMELKSSGALINAEVLIRALKKGYRMKEVGVSHYPRLWGTQTGAHPKVVFRAFSELFKLRKELN